MQAAKIPRAPKSNPDHNHVAHPKPSLVLGGECSYAGTALLIHCLEADNAIVLLHMCCIIVTRWGGPGKIEGRSRRSSPPGEIAFYSVKTYHTPPTHVYYSVSSTIMCQNVAMKSANDNS